MVPLLLAILLAEPPTAPFPWAASGSLPGTLSASGVFRDVRTLAPDCSLIPYEIIVPFWSDGASKRRWVALPRRGDGATMPVRVAPGGEWAFPPGTVFVKHFEIGAGTSRPRRLETRLLVVEGPGEVRGASYRWRPDGGEADLVREARSEPVEAGGTGPAWTYPGVDDCRKCHTRAAGGILGARALQWNRDVAGPSGVPVNQVAAWDRLGRFDPPIAGAELPRLASLDEPGRSLEDRARSYLDANCAQCHRPGGVVADFDARYGTPLAAQGLIARPARINLGVDGARLIAPNDPWRSVVLGRVETRDPTRMPPLAHEVVDREGAALLRAWIASLPGPPVVGPPEIWPPSGDYRGTARVTIGHPDPGAVVRYTRDGSAPGKDSPVYEGPFEVRESTTVRARAFKPGATRSVVSQETLVIEP